MRIRPLAFLLVCSAVAAQGSSFPEIGARAPKFTAKSQDRVDIAVGGKSKTWTVLAFYPKALSADSTLEVCSLRDAAAGFAKLGVTVYGISCDDVSVQKRCWKRESLNFALLSDPDRVASKLYGAILPKAATAKRVTFVIDPSGLVRGIEQNVDVRTHGSDLVSIIEKLREQESPEISRRFRKLYELDGRIRIDGSSVVYALSEAVAERFTRLAPRVRVNVACSGTGGGFRKLLSGRAAVNAAARPLRGVEWKRLKKAGVELVELPVAQYGVVVVANKKNTWADSLTVDELKRIFGDKSPIHTWKDVRKQWPGKPLRLFGPSSDSASYYTFRSLLGGKALRSDMVQSEHLDVLVGAIQATRGALAFFPAAYWLRSEDKARAVEIRATANGRETAPVSLGHGLYAPLSHPLFLYVRKDALDTRREIESFVEFYLAVCREVVGKLGYAPLPEKIVKIARQTLADRRTGSRFLDDKGRSKPGSLEDNYKK